MPEKSRPVRVYKFGGTSVATAKRIRHVVQLIDDVPTSVRRVVVVSAMGGVTDQLLAAIDAAMERSYERHRIPAQIRQRYLKAIDELVAPTEQNNLHRQLESMWHDLGELLDGVYLLRDCTPRFRDAILSFGERASAPLVAAALRATGLKAIDLDASQLIRTDDTFGEAVVDFPTTNKLITEAFAQIADDEIVIVPGFIASTEDGVLSTLGRSGSDYTATILGGALDAEHVEIWTDVDGVLSADPRLVPEAFPLPQLSYQEAADMAYFGAKVLHPRTMRPLQLKSIPLYIKNTLNPVASGTLISTQPSVAQGHVTAVTAVTDMAMVILDGTGLVGVPGIDARAFNALAAQNINVVMISQASSEQTLCVAVDESRCKQAVKVLENAFAPEFAQGYVSGISAIKKVTILCAIGANMRYRPGIAGRMFAALGRSGINVLAIAQGASERNISAAVARKDRNKALKALHESLVLGRNQVHVFVLGTGTVGAALLPLLEAQIPRLLAQMNIKLHVVGVANTRHALWDEYGIELADVQTRLEEAGPVSLNELIDRLIESHLERRIFVDVTASEEVARQYGRLVDAGIAVVTANKKANAGPLDTYRKLLKRSRFERIPYMYETNVGAALPIIATLRDLVYSGDTIHKIEGVLSGTLAFIFNSLNEGMLFSEAIREAYRRGYTEPDPREDLSGQDVVRKLIILAREVGLEVESHAVKVESLVPESLQSVPLGTFWEELPALDAGWAERVSARAAKREKLHYVARMEGNTLQAGVRAVSVRSPLGGLGGTENMVVYTTDRYHTQPLVVRGAGAGPEVTAAGVLADLIKATELMI